MKINPSADKLSKSSGKKKFSDTKTEAVGRSESENSFIEILESIIPSSNEATKDLNDLWVHLPHIEKQLISAPNRENLNEYRDHIKLILNKILDKNVKLVTAKNRNRTDQQVLVTARIIDEKLQLLAKTIIDKNNTAFDILKQTQDIRGLLLDIRD